MIDPRSADLINTIFEGVGAVATWANVRRLYRDGAILGIDWKVTLFWSVWGLWNLIYYPSLDQWGSFFAGIVLVAGNLVWVVMALKLMYVDERIA